MPLAFWARFNTELSRAARPGFLLVGELLDGDPAQVARTWREGHFTAMFDFPLGFAIADVFCRGQSPAKLAAALTNDRRYPDPARLVTLADNHDLPRLATLCGGDQARVRQALAFLLTARGIPSLTWGTETGLDGEKEPDNRKSMRFDDGPLSAEVAAWLRARAAHPALRDGAPVVLAVDERRLAVGRVTPDELAIVFVNHGEPWRPTLPAPWDTIELREERPGTTSSSSQNAVPSPLRGAGQGEGLIIGTGVTVWLSAKSPGRWAALFREADRQWRTGARRRVVELSGTGAPNLVAVGSGPELGDWNISRGAKLPARLELPLGGVFELKLVSRPETGEPKWAAGENHVLVVTAGDGPQRLELAW